MPDHHQHHHHGNDSDEALLAELLDLDGEVNHAYLADVVATIHDLVAAHPPRRILDLGAGTGVGTFALLERFPGADALAVDMSPDMLHRITHKARDRGVADRVRTVQADLDAAWPPVGTVDLVWAAASMHHLEHPDRVLADIHAALAPGGALAVVELDAFPRFLPHDVGVGRPGLEDRCHAAMDERRASHVPHLDADWPALLTAAGFTVATQRTFAIDLRPPLPEAAPRYAQTSLTRTRSALADHLAPDDLAALDTLLDPASPQAVLTRPDLTVRATRTLYLATRA